MKSGKKKLKPTGALKTVLAENVVAHRNALQMKQRELADKTGKSQQYISNLEAGKQNATLATIELLCWVLQTNAPTLLKRKRIRLAD